MTQRNKTFRYTDMHANNFLMQVHVTDRICGDSRNTEGKKKMEKCTHFIHVRPQLNE